MDGRIQRLAKLKADLAKATDPNWIKLLEKNIKRTEAEINPWQCCGKPVETRGLDVYCSVCKRTSR